MANDQLVEILRHGAETWNAWREDNPAVRHFDFTFAYLEGADLCDANLSGANLVTANLSRAILDGAILDGASLAGANLHAANLPGALLLDVDLMGANLTAATLTGADLTRGFLLGACFLGANLHGANLMKANLTEANLTEADLTEANLSEADLTGANLARADLTSANLSGANLTGVQFVRTRLDKANLNGCRVYGVSAWDVMFDANTKQRDLVITPEEQPSITVDNLEIAQFIYLLLRNEKIRHVIDTLTSKVVLILGRFTQERKAVLDALREALRKRDRLPVLFDFEKPGTRDVQETIVTLAGMARYIIADITDPKSIPQELVSIVPNLPSVAVQPILQEGEPWGMYDHIKRYPWVLPLQTYKTPEALMARLDDLVIAPAEGKVAEIRG